jgi:hypothetical protein
LTARYSVPEDRFNYAKNIVLKKYDNNAKGHLNFAEFTKMNIDLNAARPAVDDCVHCLADTKLKIEDLIHFLDCNRFNKNNNFILKLLK